MDGHVRYDCTGWRGTGSVPAQGTGTNAVFTLREDSTLAWQLTTNYLMRVSVVGDGTAAGYETAAKTTARNGRPVWECYVAGLDPTDATDDFIATIEMVNGVPQISVGGRGERPGRVYTVEGKENLGDSWGPTNATSRFFHIKARVDD